MAPTIDRAIDFSLYAITDGEATGEKNPLDAIRKSLDGGLKAIQLREKTLGGGELLRLAEKLRGLTYDYKARLFINDRVDVAKTVGADGVHLGASSFTPTDARGVMGTDKLIAVSTHSMEEARQAESLGADFITFGPIYETQSKLKYGPPVGLEALRAAAKEIQIPVFALGGIKADNIEEVMTAGADGVAMISTIFSSTDIEATTKKLIKELRERSIKQ